MIVARLQGREHDAELPAPQVRVLSEVLNHVYFGPELQDSRSDNDVLEHREQLVHAPAVLGTAWRLAGLIDLPKRLEQDVQLFERRKLGFDLL